MVIARVPFRVSFFGGGTDYPSWYRRFGGAVLSTTINKYCYLSVRKLPPFFDHSIRIAYSQVEHCTEINQIRHPAFREILRYHGVKNGIEAHYDSDLPARSGMGSSSAFAVGLLHAMYAFRGKMVSHGELANQAIYIEREVLGESVGSQDQAAVAHGGLNHIQFETDESIVVNPMILGRDIIRELNSHLMLYFTGTVRIASEIAKTYSADLGEKERNMRMLGELVPAAISALQRHELEEFGKLLHEGWRLKRSLAAAISTSGIDEIYEAAVSAGALGGKILGAGGGGFMLLFVPPARQAAVRERLNNLLLVPFEFESAGSQIIYYDPENAGLDIGADPKP
jgi:D-glycero-alpha-D-manno-heptose-7-phosphate kinase